MIGVIRKALLAASFPPSDHSRIASCFKCHSPAQVDRPRQVSDERFLEGASYIFPST